jgi:nitrogen fixation/metabolism regulation signal transduction histidine kinase
MAILVLLVVIGYYITWRSVAISRNLKNEMPAGLQSISDTAYLNSLAQVIQYYDEVLTQSARNYSFTGEAEWKTRYEDAVPQLDMAIKEAIAKGSETDKQIFSGINGANTALITMEENSMRLADQGDKTQAQEILNGAEYAAQKKIYQDGLNQYLAERNAKSDEAINLSTVSVQKIQSEAEMEANIVMWSIIILVGLELALFILFYFVIARAVLKPLKQFENAAKEIASGNLNQEIKVATNDEIGQLSATFNKMARELKESRGNIEKKVADRTRDLTKLNQYMVGRELKMVEMKKEINKLKNNSRN